jgi:hypothetical protein
MTVTIDGGAYLLRHSCCAAGTCSSVYSVYLCVCASPLTLHANDQQRMLSRLWYVSLCARLQYVQLALSGAVLTRGYRKGTEIRVQLHPEYLVRDWHCTLLRAPMGCIANANPPMYCTSTIIVVTADLCATGVPCAEYVSAVLAPPTERDDLQLYVVDKILIDWL